MSIKFFCTFCGQKLGATEGMAGGKIRCPRCGEVLAIPGARRPRSSARSDRHGSQTSDRPSHERTGSGPTERPTPASRRPPHVAARQAGTHDEDDVLDVELEPIDDDDLALAPLMPTYSVSEAPLAPLPASVYTPAPESSPYAAPGDYEDAPRAEKRRRGSKHRLASRASRLMASLFDGLLVPLVGVAVVAGLYLVLGPGVLLAGILVMTGMLVGGQLRLLASQGQTYGKQAFGIRIVDFRDGGHPGATRLILVRSVLVGLLSAIPIAGAIFALANMLFIFGRERRCLHDYLAGTCVVCD